MLLVDDLYAASHQGRATDPRMPARIQQDLRAIDMRDVSSKLYAVGLSHRRARIEALLKEAEQIAASGMATSPNLLRERLNSVERLHKAVCKLEEIKSDDLAHAEDVSQPSGASRVYENLSTTARMAILLGLTSFLSGVLVLGRILYRKLYAWVSARRTCRIAAALEQGLDVVDGTVTVLGRKGCRFQPVNSGAYDRVEKMMQLPGVFLVVEGRRYLMRSGLARGFFVSMFFQRPLRRKEQAALLALSSVTPREAPRTRASRKKPLPRQAAARGRRVSRSPTPPKAKPLRPASAE